MATRRRRSGIFMAVMLTIAGLAIAPVASADATDALRSAISTARGSACGPIRSDPLIDQVAMSVVDSTDRYINFTARAVPIDDTLILSVLQDQGYKGATKARLLQGAATTAATSIKAALLQGSAPTALGPALLGDCSFNAYGVASRYNAKKDVVITTAVLAG